MSFATGCDPTHARGGRCCRSSTSQVRLPLLSFLTLLCSTSQVRPTSCRDHPSYPSLPSPSIAPYSTDFFKGVFACASPLLGFDPVMPERLWGATGTVDSSKVWGGRLTRHPSRRFSLSSPQPHLPMTPPFPLSLFLSSQVEADLELAAQGFTALPIATSIVDMDLTWQKYGLSFLSSSLDRAMNR